MITANFEDGETKTTITDDVYQFDYGQVLQIEGITLPGTFDVDFSFGSDASFDSVTEEGKTDEGVSRVDIPDDILSADKTKDYKIYIYIFVETKEEEEKESGETTYVITMPVKTRPTRSSDNNDNEGN